MNYGLFGFVKWLHTGDIGCMDENGIVYFKSRAKELIIRGGVNIYPVRYFNKKNFWGLSEFNELSNQGRNRVVLKNT